MDRSAIDGLKQALAVSPDNAPLRLLLVRALYQTGDVAEAVEHLRKVPATSLSTTDRALAGEIFLAAADAGAAFAVCSDHTPEQLMVQARAALSLSRHREGLTAYDKAVAANPALEDRELRRALTEGLSDTSGVGGGNVVSFSVIRNQAMEKREEVEASTYFLQPQESKVTFADVGGLDEAQRQIHRRIILPFQKPSLFQKFD